MGRLLILIVLAVLALYVWRSLAARAVRSESKDKKSPPAKPERIVACVRCGLHVPASEAVHDGDEVYCCQDHRRMGRR